MVTQSNPEALGEEPKMEEVLADFVGFVLSFFSFRGAETDPKLMKNIEQL